jgi:hypothetical protein
MSVSYYMVNVETFEKASAVILLCIHSANPDSVFLSRLDLFILLLYLYEGNVLAAKVSLLDRYSNFVASDTGTSECCVMVAVLRFFV